MKFTLPHIKTLISQPPAPAIHRHAFVNATIAALFTSPLPLLLLLLGVHRCCCLQVCHHRCYAYAFVVAICTDAYHRYRHHGAPHTCGVAQCL